MTKYKIKQTVYSFFLLLVALTFFLKSWCICNSLQPTTYKNELYYSESISHGQANSVIAFASSEKNESGLWPTFWQQTTISCSGAFSTDTAICIQYQGDINALWPFSLRSGNYPAARDQALISTGLAQILWGSVDVIGCTISRRQDNQTINVCGVFSSDDPLLCIPANSETTFNHVTLSASNYFGVPDDFYNASFEFSQQCGLGKPFAIGWHSALIIPLLIFNLLPFLVLTFIFYSSVIRHKASDKESFYPIVTKWVLAFLLVSLLPYLLMRFPPWLIPGQWSNVDFWTALIQTLYKRWQEQLVFPDSIFSLWQKQLLFRALLCTIVSSFCLKFSFKKMSSIQ